MNRPPLDYQRPDTESPEPEREPLPRDEKFMQVFLVVFGVLALLILMCYAGLAIT